MNARLHECKVARTGEPKYAETSSQWSEVSRDYLWGE